MVIIASSCSQKLPLASKDRGIFVIPVAITNETTRGFLYRYSFIYTPKTNVKIKFLPREGQKFVIIKNFPAGQYQVEGISSTSGTMSGVEALSFRKPLMFSNPVSFEIMPQKISLFSALMVIENTWVTANETFMQTFHFSSMNRGQINNVINEIKNLPNAEGWGFAKNPGVTQDKKEPFKSIKGAAEQGFADAQYNYGLSYEAGIDVPKDLKKAAEWYRKAAEQGYPAAKKNLEKLCRKAPEVCE